MGVTCFAVLVGNVLIFGCIKCQDRPRIVNILWALGDSSIVFCIISEATWKPGGYQNQKFVPKISF